jgi:ribosomal protein S18 acetylase RimI-like enzyme
MSYITRKRVAIFLALSFLVVGTTHYYLSERGPIYEFNEERDTKDILNLFDNNWYWLLSSPDYSPSFMLKRRAPNTDPLYMGKMHLKVLREQDQFIGFTGYYFLSATVGKVLFLAIDEKFRGKRYGEQLLRYAINDLKRMGALKVKLVTRVDNVSAQALYRRVGFREMARDEQFVNFEMS